MVRYFLGEKEEYNCVLARSRDGITPKEQYTNMFLSIFYIAILIITMKNVVLSYKHSRKKIYQFLPKMNLLFFVTVYIRFVTLLDSLPILWRGKDDPDVYLYKDIRVYNFLFTFSFVSLNFVILYSSKIW